MMNVRHLKRIAASAVALAVTSAWGGQITLYERPSFNGPSFVTNDRIDTVSRQGTFNDTASSIVVNDGRWEVCSQAHFRGRCMELLPGSYPGISVGLNGRIASARQIGYADPLPVTMNPQAPVVTVNPPPVYVNPPRTAVVTTAPGPTGRAYLYEDPNFGGTWVAVDRGIANDLDWANFDNPEHRAASVRVESGNWLFCNDMAFRGDCRVLGPGEYSQPLMGGIASARQVWSPEFGSVEIYRRY